MTNCYACDGDLKIRRELRLLAIGARSALVEHEFYRCTECGEEYFLPEQMAEAQMRASSRIREEEELLQPDAIRAIRVSLGLTQDQFEKLLGVGPKTVVRWERGTIFQSKAADNLMRLVGELPEAARSLGRRNRVRLYPSADAPFSGAAVASFMNVVAITPFLQFPGQGRETGVQLARSRIGHSLESWEGEPDQWISGGSASMLLQLKQATHA
jgi:HTH-type transcriptional regulator / antitoxin MqsA